MWAWRNGLQAGADDCRLRGTSCGPEGRDRGTSCGPETALSAGPARFDCRPLQLAVRAAQHATGTIPIVFPTAFDPVGQGLVASLAQPGGNITGVSFHDPALMGKRLELLKAAVPGVTRVAYLWHAEANSASNLHETETAARALGVQLHPVEVRAPYPFDQAFATMAEAHADALTAIPAHGAMSYTTIASEQSAGDLTSILL